MVCVAAEFVCNHDVAVCDCGSPCKCRSAPSGAQHAPDMFPSGQMTVPSFELSAEMHAQRELASQTGSFPAAPLPHLSVRFALAC